MLVMHMIVKINRHEYEEFMVASKTHSKNNASLLKIYISSVSIMVDGLTLDVEQRVCENEGRE